MRQKLGEGEVGAAFILTPVSTGVILFAEAIFVKNFETLARLCHKSDLYLELLCIFETGYPNTLLEHGTLARF